MAKKIFDLVIIFRNAKKPPVKGRGEQPLTDKERLKRHFGKEWKNHSVEELPQRGFGRRIYARNRS